MAQTENANSEGYNGWTNYESWSVALWIDNEQKSQREARQIVENARNIHEASEYLEEWVENKSYDTLQSASVFRDLLTHALGRVDWLEVARHFEEENAEIGD